jgi:hypothetical protein
MANGYQYKVHHGMAWKMNMAPSVPCGFKAFSPSTDFDCAESGAALLHGGATWRCTKRDEHSRILISIVFLYRPGHTSP